MAACFARRLMAAGPRAHANARLSLAERGAAFARRRSGLCGCGPAHDDTDSPPPTAARHAGRGGGARRWSEKDGDRGGGGGGGLRRFYTEVTAASPCDPLPSPPPDWPRRPVALSLVASGNQTPGVSSVGVRENVTPNSGALTPFAVKQMFWCRQPVSGAAAWADREGGGRRSNNSVSASFEAM
ncbi:hypothetical protein EYF80_021501 [Liparis tanakae]|uniref:Uncharacterized protein n=1 Tax=Liparis tanakae TaxID=230148 RepID=A0A4Z2HRE6_9TELE|nr:hypothetical protein EYF80_021501 [Liparis tanakae]